MTFVFRFSSFVVVFVLATKVTLVLVDNPGYLADDKMVKAANRCLDESTRKRKESGEAREDLARVGRALRRAVRAFFSPLDGCALICDQVSRLIERGLTAFPGTRGLTTGSSRKFGRRAGLQKSPCQAAG